MTRYAATTEVSTEKSRAEIERTLTRYGATAFMYGWEGNRAIIQFKASGRHIKFILPLPDPTDKRFSTTPGGRRERDAEATRSAWEQACRSAWRALALVIKAKLEAVNAGIVTFESEFLSHIVMPDGLTVYEHTRDTVAIAYRTGEMPKMLPDYSRQQ